MFERTLLKNAMIIDGSGGPSFMGNVLVKGDRIVSVSKADHSRSKYDDIGSAEIVDVDGKVLAPGFIDTHAHDDTEILENPDMFPKTSQGVTFVINGNCGASIAPVGPEGNERLASGVSSLAQFSLLGDTDAYRYPRLEDYVKDFSVNNAAVNCAMLVGHNSLRLGAMVKTLRREATQEEIQAMGSTLEKALNDGALGISTGLAYAPGYRSSLAEVIALARVAAEHGRLYTTHLRDEEEFLLESIVEALKVGREADVPVVISHLKACGIYNWGKTANALKIIEWAQQEQSVVCDVYPYTASSTVLDARIAAQSESVTIASSESYPEAAGRDLDDIAREMWMPRLHVVDQLKPGRGIYHELAPEDLRRVLRSPSSMIGSDGLPGTGCPHPRVWGTFPRVLGHYVREAGLLSPEEAIHKMTGQPAKVFGLKDRGLIKSGFYADLVVFDPEKIADKATYQNPTQPSVGIEGVYVNGQLVCDKDGPTGARPGQFVRGDGLSPVSNIGSGSQSMVKPVVPEWRLDFQVTRNVLESLPMAGDNSTSGRVEGPELGL